jgi:hypothetical protein
MFLTRMISGALLGVVAPAAVLPPDDEPPPFLPDDDWRAGKAAKVNFKTDVLNILKRNDEPE